MTSLFEEADKGNPQRQRFNEGFDIGAKSHPHHLRIINDASFFLRGRRDNIIEDMFKYANCDTKLCDTSHKILKNKYL